MSAKDRRKSLALRLDPALAAALRVYARANGDRSLAAACRRALRADLFGAPDRRPPPPARPSRRPLNLRLQLEPELRAHAVDPETVRRALSRRLGVEIDEE